MSSSLVHKDIITTDVTASCVGWHLLVRVQVDVKSFLTKVLRLTCKICGTVRKEDRHPQRQDPAQLHVPIDTRTTGGGGATHTRARHTVLIVELALIPIFNVLETTRSASSNRNEELAGSCNERHNDYEATLISRREWCWTRSQDRQTEITSSQWQFKFSWTALIVQQRHQPHSFCSESSPCISMITTFRVYESLVQSQTTVFGPLKTMDVTVAVEVAVWRQNADAKMTVLRF